MAAEYQDAPRPGSPGVHAPEGAGQTLVDLEVGCGKAQTHAAPGAAHDDAVDVERPSEQRRGAFHLSFGDRVSN